MLICYFCPVAGAKIKEVSGELSFLSYFHLDVNGATHLLLLGFTLEHLKGLSGFYFFLLEE